jgi:hypothetical protein
MEHSRNKLVKDTIMQKNVIIFLNIIFLFAVGLISSCTKKNFEDHVGPSICPTSKFQILQQPAVSNASVNLNTQTQVFTAAFNEEVPWTLIVKGMTSKSYKKFSGYGKEINVSWKGNPDTLVFFQAEQCTAEFKVACKEAIVLSFDITTVNSFANFGYLGFNGDAGASGSVFGPPYGYPNLSTTTTISMQSSNPSPQGGNYLIIEGSSATPVWYFGGFDVNLTSFASKVGTDASKVYFNCFINVKGSTSTVPVVIFKEGSVNRSKTLFVYGDGWQYVSFPLSEANVVNPQNVTICSFTLNAYPVQSTDGDMAVDFITFTNDSPFITTNK